MYNETELRDALIIDDDKNVRATLEMYCENLGFFRNIVMAVDGQMASSKLSNQQFALILLDVNMPKKSGVDLLNDFKADSKNVNELQRVVIVSGELDNHILQEAMAKGVKNFLVKPFDEEKFIAKVKPIIQKDLEQQ